MANTSAANDLGASLVSHGEWEEAEKWFRDAAAEGHAWAIHNVAVCLGERGDVDGAKEWYRRAAESGDTAVQASATEALRALEETGEADE